MRSAIFALCSAASSKSVELAGLTDFPTGYIDPSNQCVCGSVARVRSGLCAKCLLQASMEGDYLDELSFELELAEINIPDRDWRLGNYQIIEEIARGGMGVVYRARHLPSQRIVALKRVLTYHSDSSETLARFQREAQAAASLEHPNILPIYDVGTTDDGLPYFSMKLAAGGSLQNVRNRFRGDYRLSAQLIVKVARAIEFAHGRGVVHRDLKPGNILLDAQGEPMVSDFGLAKWLDRAGDLTCTLTVFGTPGYIAPEQAQGTPARQTPTVDIYSLGAILFELLSGRAPFLGEHAIDVIRQATEKAAPKLRTLVRAMPRDLETICARCLDRDPARRYSSAGELAADLDRWIQDRPIVARPISHAARLWRWGRRNRALAVISCACIAVAGAAIAWEIDSSRLGNTIREEQIANHSIAVMPFLDLDEGTANLELPDKIADALGHQIAAVGPAKVLAVEKPSAEWTGTGVAAELKPAVSSVGCRVGLVGMYRRTREGGIRISIRLIDPNSRVTFFRRSIELPDLKDVTNVVGSKNEVVSIYHTLDGPEIAPAGLVDPALRDPTARAFYNGGRSLLDRRTIPDMDRAIKSFEGAIDAAPDSVLARSYLALAYMGRNYLAADPIYIERGLTAAKEALAISPDDSVGHRALSALNVVSGHFDDALEHALRALEVGDPSERALGQIAYIWEETGRPDRAIQWLGKARVNQDQPADYDALVGDAWALLVDDKRAADAYERAANFKPDLPNGWLGLCHLKLLQGYVDDARRLFEQRAGEYKDFHNTRQFRAQLELFTRSFEKAEQLYTEILHADPNGVSAGQYGAINSMSALARLKVAAGDNQAARELLQKCMAIDKAELAKSPKHPEVLYRLAAAEAINGDTASALLHLRQSITAGYVDYRSMRMDPRFDGVAGTPEFQQIMSELATHVAELRHRAQSTIKTLNN